MHNFIQWRNVSVVISALMLYASVIPICTLIIFLIIMAGIASILALVYVRLIKGCEPKFPFARSIDVLKAAEEAVLKRYVKHSKYKHMNINLYVHKCACA